MMKTNGMKHRPEPASWCTWRPWWGVQNNRRRGVACGSHASWRTRRGAPHHYALAGWWPSQIASLPGNQPSDSALHQTSRYLRTSTERAPPEHKMKTISKDLTDW